VAGGARWFWDTLVDADLAANSSAGSGRPAAAPMRAPYFRIFNPTSQAEKFDPDGAYVKKWVDVAAKEYPEPIVDHAEARKCALTAAARNAEVGPAAGYFLSISFIRPRTLSMAT